MTESRYLFCGPEVTDAFLRSICADIDYVRTQVLAADAKRLHLFIRIEKDGEAIATLEQMLLHVDMAAGKTCAAPQAILDRMLPQVDTGWPEAAGRVGKREG